MRILPILLAQFLVLLSSPAQATQWIVDYSKSRLGFTVQWSGEQFAATFRKWTADIAFDQAALGHSRLAANIDLASEASDTPDNDDGLKGPEGFWIERFRFARFESIAITAKGGNSYLALGTLSLRGFSRKITLPFVLTISGNAAHATGHTRVLRTDFGLGTGEWAGNTPVSHEVDINLDIAATKAP